MRSTLVIRSGLVAPLVIVLGACTTTTLAEGRWTAECVGVTAADCVGVAELFVGNLGWGGQRVRDDSGGHVRITPAGCPVPLARWAIEGMCWRADAPTTELPRACMLIARRKQPREPASPFGQVGGDQLAGVAGAPELGTTPC